MKNILESAISYAIRCTAVQPGFHYTANAMTKTQKQIKAVILQPNALSIFAITIPPVRTPGHLHQTFAPTLGLLHPSF